MNGRIDSGLGQIVIDTDVIATYAGSVAVECFGIVGMAAVSMKDGLVKLLRKDSLKHGISVTITLCGGRTRHRLIIRGGTCGEHKDHRCQSTFQNVSGRCQEPGSKKRMDQ